MGESINLREYIDIFKRRKVIVILIMIVSLALGAYQTYENYKSYVPTYSSTVTVRINTTKNFKPKEEGEETEENTNKQYTDPYSSYNIAQNQNIASSYNSLATSPNVYSSVASSLGVSSSEVGSITATVREGMTEFIDISVVSRDASLAKKVAEIVPEAFNQEIIKMIGIDCVQVMYNASDATLVPRGRDMTIIKFAAAGLVLSIFLVLLIECLDTKIVTPDDVVKYWDYQLIGTIPMDSNGGKGKKFKKK